MSDTSMRVADNIVVSLDYTLRLTDGNIVDTSKGREPLEFMQGTGQIIRGLERELYGMTVGDERKVTVAPADGYGERNEDAKQTVSIDAFPQGADLKPGMHIRMQDQFGRTVSAFIADVMEEDVVLDLNHPLAGETLYFDVRIAGLREPTPQELMAASGCGGGCSSCGSSGCCG